MRTKPKPSTIEKHKRRRQKYKDRVLARKNRRLTEIEDYMFRDYNSIK